VRQFYLCWGNVSARATICGESTFTSVKDMLRSRGFEQSPRGAHAAPQQVNKAEAKQW